MGIGNKLVFDVNGNVEDFIFILSTKDYRHLGAIQNVIPESVNHHGSLASGNEISFEVYKTVEKEIDDEVKEVEEPLWNEIVDLKLVYVRELDEYFEINVQLDDSTEVIKKTVTCTSLCKAELSHIYIRGLEINSEADIARDDYEPTIFCNDENPNISFIHRLFSFVPHYTIMHVDESLKKLQRTFSVDEAVFYDWTTGECAKEFNCLFQFDSTTRGVYVYDLCTVCKDCGHRAEYIDECPKCGSTNLDYFGEDTTIYIDKENLTDAVQLTTDVGAIKNCFYLEAGDDIITALSRMLNMNGTGFLFLPTDDQLAEMPEELRNRIISYNELYLSKKDEYEGIIADIFEAQSKIDYYTHTMMPTIEHAEVTAQTEADKLTAINLSPLGLSSVTESTSKSTVESTLKNYAKVYVKTGYVKLDIEQSNYTFIGKGYGGYNHGKWTGNFKVTNWSDEKDIAYSEVITIDVTDNYQEFIEQKIMKNVANNSDEESSVFDVLSISELDDFKEALKLYGLVRLQSFADAIQSALDVLLEVDQANEEADFYEPLYLPYYKKLQACQSEIDARQITIDEWKHTKDNLELQQQEIQADLNFQDYLGEDLYNTFCMYKREDTYRNENYISDGLSDSEQIEKAKDFIDVAKKELEKARTSKLSISTTLYNLLFMPAFKPIIHHFKLGNWLRICVDGIIYRLRLIGYDLSFSSIQTLSVEFANVTKINTVGYETKEILDSAKSMASNFDYFVAQAKKGNEANVEITRWLEDGLNSANLNIKNNNQEDPVIDKHGFWGRAYDDVTGNILPEQFRATHNILGFTDNNWLSTTCALGKHSYYKFNEQGKLVVDAAYGLTSQFVTAGYIYGSQIISGDIYSENYKVDANGNVISGSHLALKDGSFNFGAGSLKYNVTDGLYIKGNITSGSTITGSKIVGGSLSIGDKNSTSYAEITSEGVLNAKGVNVTGNITATSGEIGGCFIINNTLKIGNVNIGEKLTATSIDATNLRVDAANIDGILKANQIESGTIIAGSVAAENITGTTITGKTINGGTIDIGNGTFKVSNTGVMNCTGAIVSGTITATSGKIGGWNIYTSGMIGSATRRSDGRYYGIAFDPTSGAFSSNLNVLAIGKLGASGTSTEQGAVEGAWGDAAFRVRADGGVVANNLTTNGITITGGSITLGSKFSVNTNGEISSTGGTIGGWTVNKNSLSVMNGGNKIELTASGIYRHIMSGTGTTHFISWSNLFGSVGHETL